MGYFQNQCFRLGSGGAMRNGNPWTMAVPFVLHTRSATPTPAQLLICR
jgi:hypothetical protein